MNTIDKAMLLVDGAEAFDEIMRCIDAAQSSVLINMFIWREDKIGVRLANAVLRAAERGVSINISVDRVGMVLECCEEYKRSMFHKNPTLAEKIKIAVLGAGYPKNCGKKENAPVCEPVLGRLLSHPNITVDKDRKKSDHSKYYVIDDRILIFGGINVEDKECGADCAGRVYQDYMVKLEGEEHVRSFYDKLERGIDTADNYVFRMNNKTVTPAVFEMKESFLSIINSAERELVIVMAYFAPVPEILDAIVDARRRGVKISIMIPENANFQNNSNRRTVRKLMKRCNGGIKVALSPKMVHTKLIANEHTTMLGSCNITGLAFTTLGELDIEFREENKLTARIRESVAQNFALSTIVEDYKDIKLSRIIAWIEGKFN